MIESFHEARFRLALDHADEYLRAITNELFGKDTPEARTGAQPLLEQLHQDRPLALNQSLKEMEATLNTKLKEKLQAQILLKKRMHR